LPLMDARSRALRQPPSPRGLPPPPGGPAPPRGASSVDGALGGAAAPAALRVVGEDDGDGRQGQRDRHGASPRGPGLLARTAPDHHGGDQQGGPVRLDQLLPGIGDLRADDVQSYLRSCGFAPVPDPRETAVVYANERGDEVVVPLRRDLADYARRLGEL